MAADEEPPPWLNDEGESNVRPMRLGPTKTDPFRGLEHLPAIALFGRDRILRLAATPVEYLWQDIAVAGTVVLIAGPPAEGKTTLLFLILAVRLSLEKPVKLLERELKPATLGQFVVLIEGEHSESSTSRKLQRSLEIMQLPDDGLRRIIIIARKAVLVGSPEWLDIESMIAAGLVSDIGIDTLARVAPADANDEAQQVSIFNRLAAAIEKAPEGLDRPTIWAVAHTRKNNKDGSLGDVSGSVQRVGQADTVLMVKGEKVDGQTVSSTVKFEKLREDPDDYPKPVKFEIKRDTTGMLCIAGATVKEPSTAPLEEQVIDALKAGGQTKSALTKLLGRSYSHIEVAITNLFIQRRITKVDSVVKGNRCSTFELRRGTYDSTSDPGSDPTQDDDTPDLPWTDRL